MTTPAATASDTDPVGLAPVSADQSRVGSPTTTVRVSQSQFGSSSTRRRTSTASSRLGITTSTAAQSDDAVAATTTVTATENAHVRVRRVRDMSRMSMTVLGSAMATRYSSGVRVLPVRRAHATSSDAPEPVQ